MDILLRTLLETQHGVITRPQALAHGLGRAELEAAVRRGILTRLRPGVLADAALWGRAPEDERFRLTVRGILLQHPQWAASHHAAASLHDLPRWATDQTVDVVAPVTTSKRRPGLHVHRRVPGIEVVGGMATAVDPPAVSVAIACVQIAADYGVEAGVVALDAALHRGRCRIEDAKAALSVVRYGRPLAQRMVTLADPACESVGESRTRLILLALGHRVCSQAKITDALGRFVARVDFLLDRVVVEFDGAVKYAGADGHRALMAEKTREDRLRSLGYAVVRLGWRDLDHPEHVAARIARAQLLTTAEGRSVKA